MAGSLTRSTTHHSSFHFLESFALGQHRRRERDKTCDHSPTRNRMEWQTLAILNFHLRQMNDNPITIRLSCRALPIKVLFFRIAILFAILFFGPANPSSGQTADEASAVGSLGIERIDFRASILPIFERSCLECHSGDNVQGNLNLLSRMSVDEGGFTGLPIIGNSLDESELVQRISSSDSDYRMPKSGPALADDEITIITKWIEQGGSFEPLPRLQPKPTITDRLGKAWIVLERMFRQKPVRYAALFVFPLLAFWLFRAIAWVVFRKKPKIDSSDSSPSSTTLFRRSMIAISTLCCLGAVIAFQYGLLQEDANQIATLSERLQAVEQVDTPDPTKPPFIPHPMHPPRLGGVYYRGNDERSSKLFNNGFYRTAELRIELVDATGQVLKTGDSPEDGKISVRLYIKRANGTENGMFDRRTLKTTFVSESFLGTDAATDRKPLEVVKEDEEWAVTFPLTIPDPKSSQEIPAGCSIRKVEICTSTMAH